MTLPRCGGAPSRNGAGDSATTAALCVASAWKREGCMVRRLTTEHLAEVRERAETASSVRYGSYTAAALATRVLQLEMVAGTDVPMLLAEIDALREEHDETRADLLTERDIWRVTFGHVEAERDRYRAALEEILGMTGFGYTVTDAMASARRALAGEEPAP
jgi:hypothetical protein